MLSSGTMEDDHWYLAYGSNMSRAIFIERRGIRPLQTMAARLDNYRLCFTIPIGPGQRGVANLEPFHGAVVWGVLYLITAEQAIHLDRTEGVPRVYQRVAVEVEAGSSGRIAGFSYQSSICSPGRKPSPRYLALLVEGARQHGLPQDYIRALMSLEMAHDERTSPRP